MAKRVMPPLHYTKPIAFHASQNAMLVWKTGEQQSSSFPVYFYNNDDPRETMIAMSVDAQERKKYPDNFILTYGNAQQTIFMKSLRNALTEQQAFKQVMISDGSQKLSSQDVLITIYFKKTRVASPDENFKIVLDVEMLIQTHGKPTFKRTYLVESNAGGVFAPNGFLTQQINVSKKLLDKIILGIEEWHEQNKL